MLNSPMSNRTYDFLKWIAQIFLPAVGTLYFALSNLWHLPKVNEVIGTITAVDAFLGLLLKKSSDTYNKSDEKFDGSLAVDKTKEEPKVSLDLDKGVDSLDDNDEVLVKVTTETPAIPVEVAEKPKPRKRAPKKKVSD